MQNMLGNTLGTWGRGGENILGTWWEPIGNLKATPYLLCSPKSEFSIVSHKLLLALMYSFPMHFWLSKKRCPQNSAPAINPRHKWWQTVLEIEISCNQWEGSACTHDGPCFSPLQGWVGGVFKKFFLVLNVFQHVLIMFPWGSPSSQVIPEGVPNSISILFHMVCPKFNSHIHKLPLESAQWSKKGCWWVNEYGSFNKKKRKKKKFWAHPWTN